VRKNVAKLIKPRAIYYCCYYSFLITNSSDSQIYLFVRHTGGTSRHLHIFVTDFRTPHWLDGKGKINIWMGNNSGLGKDDRAVYIGGVTRKVTH
jgi:hypothetical protein